MSGIITGGIYNKTKYSCMYFVEDKDRDITSDSKFYVMEGILHTEDSKNQKPALLVFGTKSDELVYAETIYNGRTPDDAIRAFLKEYDYKTHIKDYDGSELIPQLTLKENCLLEYAVCEALKKKHGRAYLSGSRSFDNDLNALMEGRLSDLSKAGVDWKEALSEAYEELDQMELSDHLRALAKDGEHDFLEDMNDSELEALIEYLSEKYGRIWKKDPQEFYLETMLADGHYAYTSARDIEMGLYTGPVGSDMGLGMYGEVLPDLEAEDREDI